MSTCPGEMRAISSGKRSGSFRFFPKKELVALAAAVKHYCFTAKVLDMSFSSPYLPLVFFGDRARRGLTISELCLPVRDKTESLMGKTA